MSNPELALNPESQRRRDSFIAALEATIEAFQIGVFDGGSTYSIAELAYQELVGDSYDEVDIFTYWQYLEGTDRYFIDQQVGEFFGVDISKDFIPEDATRERVGSVNFKVFALNTEIEGISIIGRAFVDEPGSRIEYHLQSIKEE